MAKTILIFIYLMTDNWYLMTDLCTWRRSIYLTIVNCYYTLQSWKRFTILQLKSAWGYNVVKRDRISYFKPNKWTFDLNILVHDNCRVFSNLCQGGWSCGGSATPGEKEGICFVAIVKLMWRFRLPRTHTEQLR